MSKNNKVWDCESYDIEGNHHWISSTYFITSAGSIILQHHYDKKTGGPVSLCKFEHDRIRKEIEEYESKDVS